MGIDDIDAACKSCTRQLQQFAFARQPRAIQTKTCISVRNGYCSVSLVAQNANAVKGKLQEQLKIANQILALAELARKEETEQEKVRVHRSARQRHDKERSLFRL